MSSNVSNPVFFTLSGLTLFSERVLRDNQILLLHGERHQGTLHDRHGSAAPGASAAYRPAGPRGAHVRMGGATTGSPHPTARLRAPRHRDDDRGDGADADVIEHFNLSQSHTATTSAGKFKDIADEL